MKQVKSNDSKKVTTNKKDGEDIIYIEGVKQEIIYGLPSKIIPVQVRERMEEQASDFALETYNERIKIDLDSFILGNAVGSRHLFKEWKKEMSIKGRKGGKKSKKKQPILLALKAYLEEHPKIVGKNYNQISESFKRHVRKEEPIIVKFNGCEWDVYCADNHVFAEPDTKNKLKNRVITITYSTFLKNYISKEKELIKKS